MRTLIVDGYNIIHAWRSLKRALESAGAEESRRRLVTALAEYAAVRQVEIVVVFDGPRTGGDSGLVEVVDGVVIRFSGRHGSADHLIERLAYESARSGSAVEVTVATNDRLQGDLVRAMGVGTISARDLETEVSHATAESAGRAARSRDQARFARRLEHRVSPDVAAQLEAMRRGRQRPSPKTPPVEPDAGDEQAADPPSSP